jgi:hypothetical protein
MKKLLTTLAISLLANIIFSDDMPSDVSANRLKKKPVVHYSFDDQKNIGLDSARKKKGKPKQLKWTAEGRQGGGADFNGDDSTLAIGTPVPFKDQATTISIWIKTNHPEYQEIFSYGGGIRGLCLYTDGRKVGGAYRWDPDGFKDLSSSKIKMTDGKWHHLCCTVDKEGTITLWGDGVKLVSRRIELAEDNPFGIALLGQTAMGSVLLGEGKVNAFSGTMDTFMWFDSSLEPSEILLLYQSGQ